MVFICENVRALIMLNFLWLAWLCSKKFLVGTAIKRCNATTVQELYVPRLTPPNNTTSHLQNNTWNVILAPLDFAFFVLSCKFFLNNLLFLVRAFTNRVPHMLDNDYSPKSALDLLAKDLVRTSTLLFHVRFESITQAVKSILTPKLSTGYNTGRS